MSESTSQNFAPYMAPEFVGTTDTGETISSSTLRGKWVVLFFYPKDSSSGCSIEARGFDRELEGFQELGAEIIGVSTDGTSSHERFRERCGLRFKLIADHNRAVSQAFGVLRGVFGFLGMAQRVTFLIDPEGRIAKRWTQITPYAHANEVKETLAALISKRTQVLTQAQGNQAVTHVPCPGALE